jgi:endo-beta-N-acetylglucosaminidase D
VALTLASPDTPPSMADVLDVAQRNGVELLGPVPALA